MSESAEAYRLTTTATTSSASMLAADVNRSEACVEVATAFVRFGDWTMEPAVRLPFVVLYGILFVLGIIGNGGVVAAVARSPHLQNARNLFLVNLMLSDILLCIMSIPITPHYVMTKQWVMGQLLCRLLPMFQSVTVFVTSLSLTAIAADKFVHITEIMREPIRMKTAGVITVAIWALSIVTNIPYLLSYDLVDGAYYKWLKRPYCGHFCDEVNWPSATHRRAYGTAVTLIQFVCPTFVIVFCYVGILLKVSRDMICDNEQFSGSLTTSQRSHAETRRKRVTYILIMMVVAFFAAWFPLTLINFLRDYRALPDAFNRQQYMVALITHFIAMTTVVWNPLLFYWLTRRRKPRMAKLVMNTTNMFNSFVTAGQTTAPTQPKSSMAASLRAPPSASCPNGNVMSRSHSLMAAHSPLICRTADTGSASPPSYHAVTAGGGRGANHRSAPFAAGNQSPTLSRTSVASDSSAPTSPTKTAAGQPSVDIVVRTVRTSGLHNQIRLKNLAYNNMMLQRSLKAGGGSSAATADSESLADWAVTYQAVSRRQQNLNDDVQALLPKTPPTGPRSRSSRVSSTTSPELLSPIAERRKLCATTQEDDDDGDDEAAPPSDSVSIDLVSVYDTPCAYSMVGDEENEIYE